MKFLLSLIAVLMLSTATFADEPKTVTETKIDAVHGVRYTEERIVSLPQDEDKMYVSIFGNPTDAKYNQIVQWFKTVPELKPFQSQTHYQTLTTNTQMYQERYAGDVPALPCIRVQDKDGKVLFQVSGDNVPMTGQALSKNLNTECLRRWRERRNPQPNPEPTPAPMPMPMPDDEVDPDAQPDVIEPIHDEDPNLLMVMAVAGGGLVAGSGTGLVKKQRETYRAGK